MVGEHSVKLKIKDNFWLQYFVEKKFFQVITQNERSSLKRTNNTNLRCIYNPVKTGAATSCAPG